MGLKLFLKYAKRRVRNITKHMEIFVRA